eukprot:8195507-Alexandrium_andersonii.AAC.1
MESGFVDALIPGDQYTVQAAMKPTAQNGLSPRCRRPWRRRARCTSGLAWSPAGGGGPRGSSEPRRMVGWP